MPESEFIRRAIAFARLQFQQALRIDRNEIGFDGGGCRNRAGNDFALRQQTLYARVDQSRAELREVEHTSDQCDQSGKIEENDAPGETGKTLRDEEMPNRARHAP